MATLEKNKIYRAVIEGYSSEGLGIARIDGQVVFVHRAVRGEVCDILVLKVLKNAAFGKVVSVETPSEHRREPDCAVRQAVEAGEIEKSRYDSYLKLYENYSQVNLWEIKK